MDSGVHPLSVALLISAPASISRVWFLQTRAPNRLQVSRLTVHFFSFNCHQSRARTTYPTRSAQGFGVAREPIRVRVVVVGDAHAT